AAHLSNGLVIATLALLVFVAVRGAADVRARRRGGRPAVALVGLLVAALPVVNLAGLVPRLAYLSRTTLSLGYRGIQVRAAELAAIGLEAWREARSARRRLLLVAPGLLLWGVLPPLYGVPHPSVWIPVAGALAGAVALVAGAFRPVLVALVPVVLCGELIASG